MPQYYLPLAFSTDNLSTEIDFDSFAIVKISQCYSEI